MTRLLKAALLALVAMMLGLGMDVPGRHAPGCAAHDHTGASAVGQLRAAPFDGRALHHHHASGAVAAVASQPAHVACGMTDCGDCCKSACLCDAGKQLAAMQIATSEARPAAKLLAVIPAPPAFRGATRPPRHLASRPPPKAPPGSGGSAFAAHYARTSRQLI
jgi:hypothetical protein